MKIMRFLTVAIFSSSVVLVAQEGIEYKSYVALGATLAHGHSHDLTQKTWGGFGSFNAEVGLQFKHSSAGVMIRPNFGMAKMTGDKPTEAQPEIYDMMGIYVGVDFVYTPSKRLPIFATTGPTFHTWNVDMVDSLDNPSQGHKGMKLGWRLGLGYEINNKFKVEILYALSEWRSDPDLSYVQGLNPSNPAYFSIRASYNF